MQYGAAAAEQAWYMPVVAPAAAAETAAERVERLASESAVVVFSVSTCCMSALCGMGVHPAVHELDLDPRGRELERALACLLGAAAGPGAAPVVPVVFIGGRLVGAMDRVMAAHINGSLVPLLKEAGALWL
ncbi:hypothetical protein SETIT_7G077200v2 [Setaria italica]|uniref:Uncharacterized protein n=1 Tax=Setaria italica TaxID=4555 RepID=A0A368RT58_SETIT|nr:hypothetical protein SETIT_7G077200v2 [Setaria italica]